MDLSFNRFLVSSLLSVVVLCSMAATAADTTYTYMGHQFTVITVPYTTSMSLFVTVTLSAPLGASVTDFDAAPLVTAFSASDGVQTYTLATSLASTQFRVTTDAAGLPVDWALDYFIDGSNSMASCNNPTALAPTGLCGPSSFPSFVFAGDQGVMMGSSGFVANAPGSWSVVPAPNVPSLGPLGVAVLMSLLGLAGLGWRGRVNQAGR